MINLRLKLIVALVMALCMDVASSIADGGTEHLMFGGEHFQQALIRGAYWREGLVPEPTPEGKRIERIVVLSHDVILGGELWPQVLNALHSTTRDDVIRRELLFSPGDAWDRDLVDESARNLRRLLFISVARIVAARGKNADEVVVVVVTKDLWSLRLNTEFSFVGSTLEFLDLQLEERNLGGRNRRLTAEASLNLASWGLGQRFQEPWFLGRRLDLSEWATVFINRESGVVEGGVGELSLTRPLFSLGSEWGWRTALGYRADVFRLFSDARLAEVAMSGGERLPYSFRRNQLDAVAEVTRSYGTVRKQTVSLGWRGFTRRYGIPVDFPSVSQSVIDEFSDTVMPRSESAGLLFVAYRAFRAEFAQLMDIETFALTEDYRLGPDLGCELRAASRVFGFDSTFMQPFIRADWTWVLGDNLFSAGATASSRYQPEATGESSWINSILTFRLQNASPKFGPLRLHTSARMVLRANDLEREVEVLGGEGALRGYPSGFFRGAKAWGTNVELRSEPAVWKTVHLGGVAFVDVGGAAQRFQEMGAHVSTGVGVRILLPQFNRFVLRVDFATPLEAIEGQTPAYVVAKFGQAF